jgi:hypothetical protein
MRVGAGAQQQTGVPGARGEGRHVQRRAALGITRVGVGAGGQQGLQRAGVDVQRRVVQGRRAEGCARIAVCARAASRRSICARVPRRAASWMGGSWRPTGAEAAGCDLASGTRQETASANSSGFI